MAAFGLEGIHSLFILFIISICNGYNLDTDVPIVKKGPDASYFGYSVAQHLVTNELTDVIEPRILIGAPKGSIENGIPPVHPDVLAIERPGVVYQCPVTSNKSDCTQIEIDREPLRNYENKTDMWLGVSVSSQGTPDGHAIACAHRYRKVSSSYCHGFGMCMSMTNTLDENHFWNPCQSKEKGHEYFGYCQAGTSVDLDESGALLIGMPGPYVWRGAVMKNIIDDDILAEDPVFRREIWSPVETVKETDDGPQPATDFYSYLGSSTKIGNILNGRLTYVSGAPRSQSTGQVLLFTEGQNYLEIEEQHYLSGEQFGSNFGHEIAIADLNNDGKKDLVVSAPFYRAKNKGGAIYVYMNGANGITGDTEPVVIYSREMGQTECKALNCENARFGFSVAAIGDVDQDNFEDIAVGAPYEGNGAVYIFRGSENGIITEYSQRIYADNLPSAGPLITFGYSISGGIDMDDSLYPDVVVGSYNADKTVLLRARPAIGVRVIAHDVPDVRAPELGRESDFEVRMCFSYVAKPGNNVPEFIPLVYRLEAERFAGRYLSRVYFKNGNNPDNHVIEGKILMKMYPHQNCTHPIATIRSSTRDFLQPIKFRVTSDLEPQPPPTMTEGGPLPDINQYPVMNQTNHPNDFEAKFHKNCVGDCNSRMSISRATFNLNQLDRNHFELKEGQVPSLVLSVTVDNRGEDAHEASLLMTYPESVDYSDVDDKDLNCIHSQEERSVNCLLANPLATGQESNLRFFLEPKKVQSGMDTMIFQLAINTTSREADESDNTATLKISVIVETDVFLRGYAIGSEVEFSGTVRGETAMKTADDVGESIVHIYELVNDGPGTVANASVYIDWPIELFNRPYHQGKHILYLLEPPVIKPSYPCYLLNQSYIINPLNITVDETPIEPETQYDVVPLNISDQDWENRPRRDVSLKQKRDTQQLPMISGNTAILDCDRGTANCIRFRCDLDNLLPEQAESVAIYMKSRLWDSTFLEEFLRVDKVEINSKAWIQIPDRLNVRQDDIENDVHKITTTAKPALVIQAPKEVPLWVIIVSAVAGVIVLLLIILLMWKCGFFKRTTQDEMKKHQAEVKKQDYDYD